MRMKLWPDISEEEHLREMACFVAAPERYGQFITRSIDQQVAGFAEASIRSDYVNGTSTFPVAYLEGIFVMPIMRRRGVAQELIKAVSDWARAHGCSELASDTPISNRRSQAVHRRLGFVETERVVFFNKPLMD